MYTAPVQPHPCLPGTPGTRDPIFVQTGGFQRASLRQIGGASAVYAHNLSPLMVMDKGRWRSLESSLCYRRTSKKISETTSPSHLD